MRSVLQSHSANVERTQDKIKKIACVTSGVLFEGVDVGYPVSRLLVFAFGHRQDIRAQFESVCGCAEPVGVRPAAVAAPAVLHTGPARALCECEDRRGAERLCTCARTST